MFAVLEVLLVSPSRIACIPAYAILKTLTAIAMKRMDYIGNRWIYR